MSYKDNKKFEECVNKMNIRTKEFIKQSHENHICPYTKKDAKNVYTDHERNCIDEEGTIFRIPFNACEYCGKNKTTSERLTELLNEKMKGEQ